MPDRVTKVTRGVVADKEVQDYCNSGSSIYRYSEPEEGVEWTVIEYEVDLTSFSSNIRANIDSSITGTGDSKTIKYNGYTYITSTIDMTSGYEHSTIVKGKFAAQLPIGCTDYLIILGSASSTQAFFIGQ